MLVKVVGRPLPNVGGVGTVKNLDAQSARVLLALGRVQKYQELPKYQAPPRRTYKRKDMEPEATPVIQVEVAEEIESDTE